jgi:SsrA-binding protein
MAAKKNTPPNTRPTIQNRAASHEYQFIERFTAGIVLTGSEVKSIREGKVQVQDAYCFLVKGELYIRNLHITPYSHGGYANHTTDRERKLLLNRRELAKIEKALKENGTTVVPIKLFFNDRNLCKLELAVAKGKKLYDKRDTIKEREVKRELDRRLKR